MFVTRIAPFATLASLVLGACAAPTGGPSDDGAEGPVATAASALSTPLPCTEIDTQEGTRRKVGDKTVVDLKMTINSSVSRRLPLCAGDYDANRDGSVPIADVGVRVEGESTSAHAPIDHVQLRRPSMAIDYHAKPGFAGVDKFRVFVDKTEFNFEVTVKPFMLHAFGDSVTAGFGYFSDGSSMTPDFLGIRGEDRLDPIVLGDCKPLAGVNNRCSSNSTDRYAYAGSAIHYASDYGFGNGVSWAAQLAKMSGVKSVKETVAGKEYRTYANYAVTGSEPQDYFATEWGAKVLGQIAQDGPDVVVMTLGANPLLSQLLLEHAFECEAMATKGHLDECVMKYVKAEQLEQRMERVLRTLRRGTIASQTRIVVMLYPTVWPTISIYSPSMIEQMGQLINSTLRRVAERVDADRDPGDTSRIQIVDPPSFFFGANMRGTEGTTIQYEACDGPSKQSKLTQDTFGILGKVTSGQFVKCASDEHWVISGDTGVHPSKLGYKQMAQTALEALHKAGVQLPCDAGDHCR